MSKIKKPRIKDPLCLLGVKWESEASLKEFVAYFNKLDVFYREDLESWLKERERGGVISVLMRNFKKENYIQFAGKGRAEVNPTLNKHLNHKSKVKYITIKEIIWLIN
jgi:hypothetical protein